MPGDTITKEECKARRRELIQRIEDELEEERSFLDDLFGWGPTVDDVLAKICCKGETNGCDCEEVLQYYKDQTAVIKKLEAYLAAGKFTSFPKTTPLATAGPLGIRPKASCCVKKAVDHMEALFGPLGEGLMPTPTLIAAFYLTFKYFAIQSGRDLADFNRARAEIELGRSRAFRQLLFDIYALCCCRE